MIRIRIDDRDVRRALTAFQQRQLPFASAQALTAVARRVAEAETAALSRVFDRPTPFTKRAFGVTPARKSNQLARVFAKDIQAAYLAPFEFGGTQVLGKKQAILTPRDLQTNQYGNIPRNKIASLKGRPGVFIGTVTFRSGQSVAGVWQRGQRGTQRKVGRRGGRYGAKGKLNDYGVGQKTSLKLLIQFTAPAQVTQRLGYFQRAADVVKASWRHEFDSALAKALSTSR